MFVASAAVSAQSDTSPVKNENRASPPDARQIMESSIAATERHWHARLHYTYIERDEDRRRDSAGRVKSEHVDVSRTILVNGVPFEQLVERDGRPPSCRGGTETERGTRQVEAGNSRGAGRAIAQAGGGDRVDCPGSAQAFDFQLVGEEAVNGRPAYVLQATPHPGYHAQGKYGSMFPKVAGKLWVDKQDLGWIKVDGQVIQPFSMGLFLVRLLRGSQIKMEQTRVDGGIWMPERVEVQAVAKIFFVKSLSIDRILMYTEYRLPHVEAPTAAKSVIP